MTFPEGTLCHSGVRRKERTSITVHLHLYIGRDRARQNRAWIFSRLKSAWIISHLWRAPKAKVADYPRSFTRREIFHSRVSEYPRSMTMTNLAPASVSICNRKRVIPPLSVTDRDVSQRPQLTSHSVTVRTVFRPFVLQIEMLSTIPWHCLDL